MKVKANPSFTPWKPEGTTFKNADLRRQIQAAASHAYEQLQFVGKVKRMLRMAVLRCFETHERILLQQPADSMTAFEIFSVCVPSGDDHTGIPSHVEEPAVCLRTHRIPSD